MNPDFVSKIVVPLLLNPLLGFPRDFKFFLFGLLFWSFIMIWFVIFRCLKTFRDFITQDIFLKIFQTWVFLREPSGVFPTPWGTPWDFRGLFGIFCRIFRDFFEFFRHFWYLFRTFPDFPELFRPIWDFFGTLRALFGTFRVLSGSKVHLNPCFVSHECLKIKSSQHKIHTQYGL